MAKCAWARIIDSYFAHIEPLPPEKPTGGREKETEVAGDAGGGAAPAASTGGGKRRLAYRSALDESQTDRRTAAKVTGKKAAVAGQYIRHSFTFRPDQLASIEQIAGQLGLSQNDLMRWFVDMGADAVAAGERPPVAKEVRHRYDPGA